MMKLPNTMRKATLSLALLAGAAWPAQTAKADPMTIDVVHFWISQSEGKALDVFRTAWRKDGHEWIDLPAENKVAVQRVVAERISSSYPPAVMQWNANEGSRELPEMGIALSIDRIAEEENWRAVLPKSVIERISYRNHVYFAPTNIHAENWLWTSRKAFAKAGIAAPETWDDVFAAADKLKAQGILPIAIGGGSWEVSLIFNNLVYYALGSDGYARVLRGDTAVMDEPGLTEALQMLRRISQHVEPEETRKSKTWADASDMVGSGEAGMQFMGDWAKGELYARGYDAEADFDCKLAPGTSIAYFMVIDAFAFPLTNREETTAAQYAFAKMVLDPLNQLEFSKLKGSLPVRMDVNPEGLDRCGKLGLRMISEQNKVVSAQSMAMPSQMSEGWISVLADFFNDESISVEEARIRLRQILEQK